MKRLTAALLLLVPLLLPLACSDPAGPGGGRTGGILFASDRDGADGSFDIFRIDPDGTDVENVTRTPAGLYAALTLSPDGSRVAFMSDRDGCYDIWTMDVDGSDVTQLTGKDPNRRCSQNPQWSPDGTRIEFLAAWEADQNWHVYVMDADGGNPHRVSNVPDANPGNEYPSGWTPDGRVVFWRFTQTGVKTVYAVNADGTGAEPLFDEEWSDHPVWSPDGSLLAYTRYGETTSYLVVRDGAGAEDTLASLDASAPATLIGIPGASFHPWSPDGSRIAFNFVENGIRQIAVVDAGGAGEPLRLTDDPEHTNWFKGWSPDGDRIIFTSDPAGDDDVFLINADGTGLLNLTDSPARDRDPLWLPDA